MKGSKSKKANEPISSTVFGSQPIKVREFEGEMGEEGTEHEIRSIVRQGRVDRVGHR